MLTVEEVEMKRVRREEHFSKTRTFKKQKSEKKVKILKYYFLPNFSETNYHVGRFSSEHMIELLNNQSNVKGVHA